jgi:thiol-disulfide isomerase/thioredoxin
MTLKPVRLALCGWLALTGVALAADRTAEEILKDYDAVEVVKYEPEKKGQPGYVVEYRGALNRADRRKAELAHELFRVRPDHQRLPAMLIHCWKDSMMSPATAAGTVAEIDEALPFFKDKAQIKVARQMRVISTVHVHLKSPEQAMPELDRFLADYPKDPLGASLLSGFASTVAEPALKLRLLNRLIAEFPDHPAAKGAKGSLTLLEKLGKPFALSFRDAIKKEPVSMERLKGKVVVVDVWATWCGPCVAEMPKMKSLYARYKDRGVEFIGVSLDQPEAEGGLDKLKTFVAKNEIPWPQYYDGKAWDGPLVEELGVRAIPAVFLIDAEGKLASIDARGHLDELIPEYLARRDGRDGAVPVSPGEGAGHPGCVGGGHTAGAPGIKAPIAEVRR